MIADKKDCSLFRLFNSTQLNVSQHEENCGHCCQSEKVLPQIPSSAMMDPSIIENVFTRHRTHMSLIRQAEFETSKFVDGEHVRGISDAH